MIPFRDLKSVFAGHSFLGNLRFRAGAFLAARSMASASSNVLILFQSLVAAVWPLSVSRWVSANRLGMRNSALPATPHRVTRMKPSACEARMAGAIESHRMPYSWKFRDVTGSLPLSWPPWWANSTRIRSMTRRSDEMLESPAYRALNLSIVHHVHCWLGGIV